ncbi:hypothetical protein EDB81DRAFT_814521 [Dactylonectria macrodidyma]|uniref:Zn(2)-C6 fungal-type domain-containing protein n=1 Tax=Dactylonectria macrodidyma TaxID=307937 RepID=A0A9P9DJK0_9HYPO|nr:hypothetical protein EDB81DRAFT_814521 [Dactylonectria macrodidyma]
MADQPNGSRRRIRKTSEICAQCRNRKVKCDGSFRGCDNCKRLRFECSLVAVPSEDPGHIEILERRRVSRACIPCRDRKLKCSGRVPACSRCLDRRVECRYPVSASLTTSDPQHSSQAEPLQASGSTSSARDSNHPSASPRDSVHPRASPRRDTGQPHTQPTRLMPMLETHPSWELGINKQTIKQHIDAFFDLIYPIPCYGFFHRATLLQSWSRNELNPCVLQAICGLTSRFMFPSSSERRDVTRTWIEDTESQLLSRLAEPRMSDIEAWLLITLDHYLARRFSKMLVSMALTSRLAYILRLNHEDNRQTFLAQERRRRLMWSIYAMDTLYSSGKAEFTACTADTLHIRLPCNEKSFSMDQSVTTQLLHPAPGPDTPNIGLLGYCLRVLDIRDRVQRLTLTITNHRKPINECLLAVDVIENELRQFYTSLPSRYHFDLKSFSLRAFSPSRTPFLMLHTWWHQAHCDLFRFTIPGFREGLPIAEILQMSPEFTLSCREKCLFHAVSVSRILETPKTAGGSDLISDPSVAMCAFHSARIISRLAQYPMGDMPQMELVARLSACAKALEEQAAILPTTAILKKGIEDLVNDAQRNRDGPYACPSIWEDEEFESTELTRPVRNHEGESGTREVYSKHSVTDIVCNLHFQPRERDDDAAGNQMKPLQSETPDTQLENASKDEVTESIVPAPQFMPMLITSQLPEALDPDTRHYGYSREAVGYEDSFLTLGFDPRYDSGQPDLFMDSFWPLADGDWTMPDIDSM